MIDRAEVEFRACMGFPAQHRGKLHATNPVERLNGEIKRRTAVVGIVLNKTTAADRVGATPP